jgi:hypothetical protein
MENDSNFCENCDEMARLQNLDRCIEKVKDMLQAAELLGTRREYERGRLVTLREVVRILEQK